MNERKDPTTHPAHPVTTPAAPAKPAARPNGDVDIEQPDDLRRAPSDTLRDPIRDPEIAATKAAQDKAAAAAKSEQAKR